jgi:hypothetical protein
MKNKFYLFLMLVIFSFVNACSPAKQVIPVIDEPSMQEDNAASTTGEVAQITSPESAPTEADFLPVNEPVEHTNPVVVLLDDFYLWYFDQPGEEIFIQSTYENHPFLSDIFKSDLGYLLDSFEGTSGYDPFTCAQEFLPSLTFDPAFVNGGEAYVLGQVLIDGETRHYLVVQLGKGEGTWKIEAIHCPFDPRTTAIAFYTAYLGHITGGNDVELGIEFPLNPLEDGYFEELFMISSNYRQQIEAVLSQGNMSDPVLSAQTFPQSFWVEPGQEGEEISVRLTFGPQSERYYTLHLLQSPMYYWLVDDITTEEIPLFDAFAHAEVDTSDWQVFTDEDYAMSFRYPQDWSVQKADLSAMPSDDPMKKGFFFFPSWASANLPALRLNILQGTEAQIMDYYVTESHQLVQINEYEVWVDRDQCETRFVFQNPEMDNTWIIIGDNCPGIQGRERYAEELETIIAPLLRTVEFESN